MFQRYSTGLFVSCTFFILAAGCGSSEQPIEATYHGGIRALIETKCVRCHDEGGIGPFSLDDPETVKLVASSIVTEVESRRMPPWGMDPDCRQVADSPRLSDAEVAAFAAWRDDGFPDGDLADYRAPDPDEIRPRDALEDKLGPPQFLLEPAEAYTPDTQRPDDYRCIVLPEAIDRDLFLYAVDVLPDQLDLVHHVIVYAVPPGDVATIEARDAADPGPGFSCFSDTGVESADAIGGWVPGSTSDGGSKEAAMRVSAGSRLVLQMHYNVAGREASEVTADATSIALWALPEGAHPDYVITSMWIPNANLNIPAGSPSSVHSATMRLPVDGYAVAVSPHMHLLGKRIQTNLIRDSGKVECLTKVDDWDFSWQRNYVFSDFVPVDISDKIEITCEYDNSPANQPVINGERQEPRDVTWGEGTFDEMCLDSVTIATPFWGRGESGVCAGFRRCFDTCKASDPFCAMACMTSSGFACLTCGTEGLFGSCARANCPAENGAVEECLYSCVETESGLYDCLYDECRSEFDTYYGCVQPTLKNGTCADDFADCEGIAP